MENPLYLQSYTDRFQNEIHSSDLKFFCQTSIYTNSFLEFVRLTFAELHSDISISISGYESRRNIAFRLSLHRWSEPKLVPTCWLDSGLLSCINELLVVDIIADDSLEYCPFSMFRPKLLLANFKSHWLGTALQSGKFLIILQVNNTGCHSVETNDILPIYPEWILNLV